MIVILCDGSSKGNPGPASIGVIAWDRENPRAIVPNHSIHTDIGVRTNMEAEWEALLAGMRLALMISKGQDTYIFSDSQTVVKQATKVWKIKHERIRLLYNKFVDLEILLVPTNLFINWVPRQLMYLVDKAAQKGVKE